VFDDGEGEDLELDTPKMEINNRRDLHQLLERVLNRTYDFLKEYQKLDVDLNMVKSYIVESHKPINELKFINSYDINIRRTEDPTLFVIEFKSQDSNQNSILYVDVFDERFWIIHTVEKSKIIDPFINKIVKSEIKKDHVWFPSQYMESFKDKGFARNITIQYTEMIGAPEEQLIGDLSMKLWGSSTGNVLELLRRIPQIRSIIQRENDDQLSRILEVCEGLSHSSPVSGIGIKYLIDGDRSNDFVFDDIMYNGKFTARGGESIEGHLFLVRNAKEEYAKTIQYIEKEISLGLVRSNPLEYSGHPISIILSRPIENINIFSDIIMSCKQPFRFMGFPRYKSTDFIAINGIDLHTGSKLNLEISPDWIRLYLPRGSCGNTVARFYSLIQHRYDSNARLEGVEYGNLF
jgi:hypothetical protein